MADATSPLPSVTLNLDAPAVKRLKTNDADVSTILNSDVRTRKNKKIKAGALLFALLCPK